MAADFFFPPALWFMVGRRGLWWSTVQIQPEIVGTLELMIFPPTYIV